MKLDKRYEIQIVVLEIKKDGTIGDIYNNYFEFRFNKPNASYRFAYIVYDNDIQSIPEDLDDWYDTIEEAISAYQGLFLPFN